jgi:hypothetical protein
MALSCGYPCVFLGYWILHMLTVLLVSSRPVPFKVNVSARFPEAVALLAGECELRGH